jgi:hypothetical protein
VELRGFTRFKEKHAVHNEGTLCDLGRSVQAMSSKAEETFPTCLGQDVKVTSQPRGIVCLARVLGVAHSGANSISPVLRDVA